MPDRRIVVSGASGLLGSALCAAWEARGVEVTRLVRRAASARGEIQWNPTAALDPGVLDGAQAVVCLNGASIGRLPWTRRYRHDLVWSRVTPTRTLATAVSALGAEAPAFVSSSGINYYGANRAETVDESASQGDSFLADLCGEWENAARLAGPHSRVVHLRTSPVMHPRGVLRPLMLLTRWGLSGPLGAGTQVWPWISFDDAVGAIDHAVHGDISGPVNLVGPTRATANDVGFALARRMNRPFVLRAPAWALRTGVGHEAAEDLLLIDLHATPTVLQAHGFTFTHPTIEDAIAAVIPAT